MSPKIKKINTITAYYAVAFTIAYLLVLAVILLGNMSDGDQTRCIAGVRLASMPGLVLGIYTLIQSQKQQFPSRGSLVSLVGYLIFRLVIPAAGVIVVVVAAVLLFVDLKKSQNDA